MTTKTKTLKDTPNVTSTPKPPTYLLTHDQAVEWGKLGGRPPKISKPEGVKQSLEVILRHSLAYLFDVSTGAVVKINWGRMKVAEMALDHVLGKPAMKLTLPTDSEGRTIVPYSQIIVMAEKAQVNLIQGSELYQGVGINAKRRQIAAGIHSDDEGELDSQSQELPLMLHNDYSAKENMTNSDDNETIPGDEDTTPTPISGEGGQPPNLTEADDIGG